MPSNAQKKHAEEFVPALRTNTANDNAQRIMARTRYEAPSVASYSISGCEQSGPLSMVGNTN